MTIEDIEEYSESVGNKIVNKFARVIEEKELTNEILEFLQVTRKHGLDMAISLDELEQDLATNPDAGEIIDELFQVPGVKNIINAIMDNTCIMMEKVIQMNHGRGEDIDYIIDDFTDEYDASPFNFAIQNVWGYLYDAIK
jgi:hypothetical protein